MVPGPQELYLVTIYDKELPGEPEIGHCLITARSADDAMREATPELDALATAGRGRCHAEARRIYEGTFYRSPRPRMDPDDAAALAGAIVYAAGGTPVLRVHLGRNGAIVPFVEDLFMRSDPARDKIDRAAERILFALHIYGGYNIKNRGPLGCLMDALDSIAPDVATDVRETDFDVAYGKHFNAETGERRVAPRVFRRSSESPDDGLAYETCAECHKHIRHHFGSPETATKRWPAYRCDPKPEDAVGRDLTAPEKPSTAES